MNQNQVADDFKAFSEPSPEEKEKARKEKEARAKKMEQEQRKLKPEQIKAAEKLTEQMKAEAEAEEKAKLLMQYIEHLKFMEEYHAERVPLLGLPKTVSAKNSCEQLRVWIKTMQQECGKKGGLDAVKLLWMKGFETFEYVNEGAPFGLHVEGIGGYAGQMITPRMSPEGTLVPGPAVPLLAEFAVKHSGWFYTSVEVRLGMMILDLIAQVHRLNTQKDVNVEKAAKAAPSNKTKEAVNKI